MSLQNSNFQENQVNIRANDYLSDFQFKKSQTSQKDNSGRNSQLKKNSKQGVQNPSQFQSKEENQIVIENQPYQNVENQSQVPKNSNRKNSSSSEKKKKSQHIKTQIEENCNQINQQVHKNSQLKIQPAFSVNIQITKNNNQVRKSEKNLSSEKSASDLRVNKQQNEQQPVQLIQSNIFSSQNREFVNRRSSDQQQVSEIDKKSLDTSFYDRKLSSYEIKMRVKDDPMLKDKQDILSDLFEILKQLTIRSIHKRHSILEDSFQLCLLLLPEIRVSEDQLHSLKFFDEIKVKYRIERTYQAFKRRFYHLQIFSDCWNVQNLQKIYEIIKNSSEIQLQQYFINYCIINKTIDLPPFEFKKKSPNKPQAVQEIIATSQNKKIVLSMTTKTLSQYVDIPAKEIDEDIQEFEDELQFIDMILKLIPLAL